MRQTINLLILDFSKAFDTVPHRRLLHKIQHYGVEGLTNKWIGSWLCQRKQKVVLDGYSSEESSVISGVPRGTVLGPLMFLIYVNDIADKISPQTRIKLFADDCLLYRTIDTKQDHKQLQQDLNTLVDWSHTWLMRFNAAKCHLLKITRKTKFLNTEYKIENHTLQRVSIPTCRSRIDIRQHGNTTLELQLGKLRRSSTCFEDTFMVVTQILRREHLLR